MDSLRKTADEGYDVRCLVRPLLAPADFFRHWGAIVVNESQFYDAYTRNVFRKIQGEVNGMMYFHLDPNNENDISSIPDVEKFNIKECSIKNQHCMELSYIVEYRANGKYFDCNSRKFESSSLLCRHIFEVMKMNGIRKVHERYIMRRWRMDVLRRHSSIVHSGGYR
ncbi:hypothetical protein Syun_002184 [Stephania yunnanensis]|uniref:Protein FAR1-RELATED SEQUENCE n=1 Tax=Stephania yunnanensis TaxID=152371 RepID=A0AAP0LL01_9MAGN